MTTTRRIVCYHRLDELWDGALAGWFEARVASGLPQPGSAPPVVLAPDVVRLGWLKRSWLEQGGGPLLGVRFWTPGRLRRHLLEHFFPELHLATAEDLTLAARLELIDEPEDSPLGVIGRQPAGFLAAWDAWLAARGEPILFARPWQRLPGRLTRRLRRLGLISVREVDARLAELPADEHPLLGPILVDGFSGMEAPLYGLLRAALNQAESGLMTTPLPRDRRLEEAWVGTFEMALASAAEPVAGSAATAGFEDWAQRAEAGVAAVDEVPGIGFRLFGSRQDEVNALLARVTSLCGESAAPSIGVALPHEPLLVRAVADGLLAAGVPVHDTFGFFPAAGAAERLFGAWVEFQRTGQLVQADAFLEVLVDGGRFEAQDAERVRRAWRWARERALSDEVAVLTTLLESDPDRPPAAQAAVAWGREWVRLPESASIPLFLDLCAPAFRAWGGEREFSSNRSAWAETWDAQEAPVERALFLDWMWGSLRRPGRARNPAARDAFSPVQLVTYERVRSARWSHLLLAGLNERLVPMPSREGAFLSPDAADRHLETHLTEGPQGAGQEALAGCAGFLLDDNDRRALLSGALYDAIADTGERVELFATYAPEGDDRTATVLSEFYQRLYRAAVGAEAALPEVENVGRFEPDTATWESAPVAQTAVAYARRFDPATPFDEFSFGWKDAPSVPLELGARDWEAVVQRPASVWLGAIAKVRPREDFAEPVAMPLLRGAAAHDLLRAQTSSSWFSLANEMETGAWQASLESRAARWRKAVESAHALSGRSLSPLWLEQWGRTRAMAQNLRRLVVARGALPWMISEWTLPDGTHWFTPGGGALPLRGRVDALLVDHRDQPTSGLLIDFKTGGDTALRAKDLRKGKGLQLVLYGGALSDLYQCPVGLCLLKPDDTDLSVQWLIGPGEDPSELLPGLVAMSARGLLGFVGDVRSEYAFVGDYPMALVAPPAEIAEAKWALTHPQLPREPGGET